MHREKSLFGADPDAWRPERWLCGEAKQQEMYNSLLTVGLPSFVLHCMACLLCVQFGAGHRSCLGKHLAYFETYKLVPSLLRQYNVSAT